MFTPSQWQMVGAAKAVLVFGIIFVIVFCLKAEPVTREWEREAWVPPMEKEEPLFLAPAPVQQAQLCRDPRNQAALVDCEALR